MQLRVPVESGPELDLPFLFIWQWNGTFTNWPDFWFTFPYHPKFWTGSLGLFLHPCVNATSLLPVFWNGPERTSVRPCKGGVLYKICMWPIELACQPKTASIQALVSDIL